MQETNWNDRMKFTDDATQEDFIKAIFNPENKSVALHKPGSRVTYGDSTYEVQPNGSWKRIPYEAPNE